MRDKLTAFYLYVAGKGISNGMFFSVWILFLRECGLSFVFIGVIGVMLEVARMIFEIPCGAFADAYGKDKSLIASSVFHAAAFTLMAISQTAEVFGVSAIVFGIGDAFHSGAYEAWLMDYLEAKDGRSEFKRKLTRALVVMYSMMVVSSLVAGHLYERSYQYILIIPIMANCAALFFSLTLGSNRSRHVESNLDLNCKKIWELKRHMWSAVGLLTQSRRLMLFMIVIFFTEWALDGIERFYQPFLANESIPVTYISYIYSFSALLGIALLLVEDFLSDRWRICELNILAVVKLLIIGVVGAAVVLPGWASYCCISAFFALHYLLSPSSQTYLNRIVTSSSRATCLSIYSFVGALGEVFAGIVIGVVAQYYGVGSAMLVSVLCLVPALAVIMMLKKEDSASAEPTTA